MMRELADVTDRKKKKKDSQILYVFNQRQITMFIMFIEIKASL